MASHVRIYVEGDPLLRPGFLAFFKQPLVRARSKAIAVEFVFCKSRALKTFSLGIEDYPDDLNLLLVDAEEAVKDGSPWVHLESRQHNRLPRPDGASDDQAHLMVQVMESWFLAHKEALAEYFGQGFLPKRIPAGSDIEAIAKDSVIDGLNGAASKTKKNGYHKTIHAPEILAGIDPAKVRAASPWCDRLFNTIEAAIERA